MRALLLVLIAANLALFAYQQGWLGQVTPAGREPGRLAQQIEPQAIRVLGDDELKRLRERPRAADRKESVAACVELGDFAPEVAARVQERLDALGPAARYTLVDAEGVGWYMVFVPPLKTRADAERTAEDLRARGVRDLMVIEDNSSLRNAISLGQFKDQDLALKHQADLERRGVKNVRISLRTSGGTMRFRIRPADAAVMPQLTALQKEFAATRLAACAE